jgi:transcriptional regulator MraZ
MDQPNAQSGSSAGIEAPRGFFPTRVDDKGRLKLPSVIAEYIGELGDQKVFVTTVDGSSARIYPISAWRRNEILLEEDGEDTELKEDVAFVAYHFGADSDVDAQGRVLIPTELRRMLRMEGEQVHLRCFKQRIDVIGDDVYRQRLAKALSGLNEKVQELGKKGLR